MTHAHPTDHQDLIIKWGTLLDHQHSIGSGPLQGDDMIVTPDALLNVKPMLVLVNNGKPMAIPNTTIGGFVKHISRWRKHGSTSLMAVGAFLFWFVFSFVIIICFIYAMKTDKNFCSWVPLKLDHTNIRIYGREPLGRTGLDVGKMSKVKK
jgi:hypothetical protein